MLYRTCESELKLDQSLLFEEGQEQKKQKKENKNKKKKKKNGLINV